MHRSDQREGLQVGDGEDKVRALETVMLNFLQAHDATGSLEHGSVPPSGGVSKTCPAAVGRMGRSPDKQQAETS